MNDLGYTEPFRLLDPVAARDVAARLRSAPDPSTWLKGAAATSPEIYALATRSDLLDRVESAIGPDIVLCGANLVERDPGQEHPWHVDAHFAGPGRGVSLWLGLENVDAASTLHVVPGSHRYGAGPQQLSSESGRDPATDPERVLELARTVDHAAQLVPVPLTDGEAVLFDAAIWHGTLNEAEHVRTALVVHYASSEMPIRIHGHGTDWPTAYLDDPLPPCQVVRGTEIGRQNRLVAAPPGAVRLNAVHHPDPELHSAPPDWKPDPFHHGPTATLAHLILKKHVVRGSAQEHGAHSHPYDQIIVVLEGEGALDVGGDPSDLSAPLSPTSVAFLPAGTVHNSRSTDAVGGHVEVDIAFLGSLRNGPQPPDPLGTSVVALRSISPDSIDLAERGRSSVTLFEGPSISTDHVAVKRVDLAPGFEGEPDVDDYDVVLVVHSGRLRTLDEIVEAGGVVLYGAGEEHRLAVDGDEAVLLTVIELRGRGDASTGRWFRRGPVPSMGASQLRRSIVRRLPRGVRLTVRRWRRRLSGRR